MTNKQQSTRIQNLTLEECIEEIRAFGIKPQRQLVDAHLAAETSEIKVRFILNAILLHWLQIEPGCVIDTLGSWQIKKNGFVVFHTADIWEQAAIKMAVNLI